ncbi:MAG: MFS transporter [Acidimicrobiia bacterium]
MQSTVTSARTASTIETSTVYAAGMVQGIALVTFPAASTIFTSDADYGLSSTAYGAMFVPQAVTAISSSLLGAALSQRVTTRTLYLLGLVANLVAMALLVASQFFTGDESTAYPLLLGATASLGIGFGLTVPALNTLTAAFHPARIDGSVLVLNALLGLGTASAPVFVAVFVGLGFWWGLPVMSGILLVALLGLSLRLPLHSGAHPARGGRTRPAATRIPRRFWAFGAFALLYGICETMNGNWAQIDMTSRLDASATVASIALTAFWASVTAGRILFGLVQRWFPTRRTYRLLPFVLAATFVVIALLPDGEPAPGVIAFGLAGLGCSALLPLTVSFGQEELTAVSAAVAGGVIACYQLGYGIAAFGVGPLHETGVTLPTLFAMTGVVAAIMGALSFVVSHRRPEPASLHPRPAAAKLAVDPPASAQGAVT